MKWALLLLAGAALPATAQTTDLPPSDLVIRVLERQRVEPTVTRRLGLVDPSPMAGRV